MMQSSSCLVSLFFLFWNKKYFRLSEKCYWIMLIKIPPPPHYHMKVQNKWNLYLSIFSLRYLVSKTEKYYWSISKFVESGSIYRCSMCDQTKPIINQNKRKKQEREREKRQFSLFCVFLKTSFWAEKMKFSPFFSEMAGPIGLKIFSQILRTNSGVAFFSFFENIASMKFGSFWKTSTIWKISVSRDAFSILLLQTFWLVTFQKKKATPRLDSSV